MNKGHSDAALRVAVVFGPDGRMRPVWFDLDRRRHDVRSITNTWRERRGALRLWRFHVTDDGALYELVYNPESGAWNLTCIESL